MDNYRSKIELHNIDCMEFMKTCKDNQFDLAIVDPPYMDSFNTDNWVASNAKQKNYKNRQETLTNKKPNKEYFHELMRVSKNQIIWGGNYFTLPISRGWIFWLKNQSNNYFSDGELAWTSFDRVLKVFDFHWSGMLQGDMKNKEIKIHPTQKPKQLYKWLLNNYAEKGQSILDTHFGSLSIGLACDELGFDLTACELDKDYFEAGKKRLDLARRQTSLF